MPETVKNDAHKMCHKALNERLKYPRSGRKMRLKNAPDGAEWRREKEQITAKITSLFKSKKPPLTR